MKSFHQIAAACLLVCGAAAQASPVVLANTNASALANAIAGTGISVSNATLTYAGVTLQEAPTGTFTNGGATVGFDNGIVLTNGTINCVAGPNSQTGCGLDRGGASVGGRIDTTTLAFDFSSDTGSVFFQYVFASEEYNEFVREGFNDQFELLLNGVNIALLPGGGVVSIDNVNCESNSAFYRNNAAGAIGSPCVGIPNLGLNIQYDGLTAVLTASGSVSAGAVNNFQFTVFDRGDNFLDSAVFIRAGSFSGTPPPGVPEPGSLALAGLALAAAAAVGRRRRR